MSVALADDVTLEQSRFLHAATPVVISCTCLAAVFASYILWNTIDRALLGWWLGTVVLTTGIRLVRWRGVGRAGVSRGAAVKWIREMQAGALASGSLWGVLAIVVLTHADLAMRVAWMVGVVFLSVACCFSYGARLSVFVLFFLPATLPAIPCLYFLGPRLDRGLAGGLVLFIIVMIYSAWRFNSLFVRSLRLGFSNTALVAQLSLERDAAEQASRAKSRVGRYQSRSAAAGARARLVGLDVTRLRPTHQLAIAGSAAFKHAPAR